LKKQWPKGKPSETLETGKALSHRKLIKIIKGTLSNSPWLSDCVPPENLTKPGFENKPAINLYKKHGLTKESLQLEMECR